MLREALAQLREAGDRQGFRDRVDAFAEADLERNVRYCLPKAARDVDRVLADLGDEQLLVRPCFGWEGAVLTVRTDTALDTLVELGPDLGEGIVRLVIVPGLGRDHLAELLTALPLEGLRSLRMEGNDVRSRQAFVTPTTGNVVHLRIEGDDRILRALTRMRRLQDLRLAHNRLGTAGCVALASLRRLLKLDLSGNPIRDAGAFRLAKGLPLLRELRVRNCEIGDRGAEELAERPLEVLDLSGNPLSDELRARLGRHVLAG